MSGKVDGFYTREIRTKGSRQGFEIITLSGDEAVLAHVNIPARERVGKYGVDVEALDRVGVQSIRRALDEDDIVVVDEIGKMELLSTAFRQAIADTLNSKKKLLGTIMLKSHPWADSIKADARVEVLGVTKFNHNQALERITRWLQSE